MVYDNPESSSRRPLGDNRILTTHVLPVESNMKSMFDFKDNPDSLWNNMHCRAGASERYNGIKKEMAEHLAELGTLA